MKKEAEFLENSTRNYCTVQRYVREDRNLQKFFHSENQEPMKMENISLRAKLYCDSWKVIKRHVREIQ
jgi:hypothetical protein